MSAKSNSGRTNLRRLPIAIVIIGAILGVWLLRDTLTFEALRENRQILIDFRDANPVWSVVVFISIYTLIVAFSLPGATVATLTGGFLFAEYFTSYIINSRYLARTTRQNNFLAR